MHEERADAAHIAEALHGEGQGIHGDALLLTPRLQRVRQAAAGRFISAERPARHDGLARDDARRPFAGDGAVFIGDPRHDLGFVFTSGAGTSLSGPMKGAMRRT